MTTEPTVYIVDDEPGVRKALQVVVESAGLRVATFESAEAFLDAIQGDECGCVLLDLRLQGMSGMQVLNILKISKSPLVAVVVTGHGDVEAAVESMKQGAMDFLQKPLDHNVLLVKIEEAMARSQSAQLSRAHAALGQSRLIALTTREREILKLLVAGKSSKQIATDAGISLKTVSNHRAHLLAKTGAENTADLVRMAVVAKLVDA